MLNSEVEAYLKENDIIIVPVGTVEMHGGMPLDSETVISEAYALKMAEACNGLVLSVSYTHLDVYKRQVLKACYQDKQTFFPYTPDLFDHPDTAVFFLNSVLKRLCPRLVRPE